jgi:hypothetical protein
MTLSQAQVKVLSRLRKLLREHDAFINRLFNLYQEWKVNQDNIVEYLGTGVDDPSLFARMTEAIFASKRQIDEVLELYSEFRKRIRFLAAELDAKGISHLLNV